MAPAIAIGDTTLACAWTTSNFSSLRTWPSRRSAPGVNANPEAGARGARIRCTGIPSTTSSPRVVVTMRASTSDARRASARSRRWSSIPPCRGRNQSQTRATRTSRALHQQVERELRGRIRTPKALELVVPRAFGHEAHRDGGTGIALDEEDRPEAVTLLVGRARRLSYHEVRLRGIGVER